MERKRCIHGNGLFEENVFMRRGIKRKRGLLLARSCTAPFPINKLNLLFPARTNNNDQPCFMNTMDEITYWIYTKRAPCLFNFDNPLRVNEDEPHSSKRQTPKHDEVIETIPSPKKKKRRKLSILDNSVSSEKQQNIYFETSQQNNRTLLSSHNSEVTESDFDFNIKNSSVQVKPKKNKLQKSNKQTLHKKNKIITSTPKTTNLRRSLRKIQKSINKSDLDNSFKMLNENAESIRLENQQVLCSPVKFNLNKVDNKDITNRRQVIPDLQTDHKPRIHKKKVIKIEKPTNNTRNGHFEDDSDVSGFTANYIRSTKVKNTKNIKRKSTKNLVKESVSPTEKLIANNSVNLNLSDYKPDTTQNFVNVNSVNVQSKQLKESNSRSTSLLKFIDSSMGNHKHSLSKSKQNGSYLMKSHSPRNTRYPARNINCVTYNTDKSFEYLNICLDKRKRINRNSGRFANSDRKENPNEKKGSKTRSGLNSGLALRQPENSVLMISNSTENSNTEAAVNLGTPMTCDSKKVPASKITPKSTGRAKVNRKSASKRVSLRDKSGFATCFSDSDDDRPTKSQKYFC